MSRRKNYRIDDDGGYYAIRGFLYQYGKYIWELLNSSSDTSINIENIQDIDSDNYVMQVKYRESINYSPSIIKEPIKKLIEVFTKNKNKNIYLYVHFKNRKPEEKIINLSELESILKDEIKDFSKEELEKFIAKFKIYFSEDYISQWEKIIKKIKKNKSIQTEEAYVVYAIIRNLILQIVLNENKENRNLTRKKMEDYIDNCRTITFESMYREMLGEEKFLKVLKKQYFTFKKANINKFERLFIINGNEKMNEKKLLENISRIISEKYYKKDKSPAPYICFRGFEQEIINQIKYSFYSTDKKKYSFCDGTLFNGDKFHLEVIKDTKKDVELKFILEDYLKEIEFNEEYEFFLDEDKYSDRENIKIRINKLEDIKKLIE